MTSRFPPFAFVELVSPYNKKNITRWLEHMNFMFSWQEQYLTRSLRSLVRYCSCHSNIKFISSRHRVISSIYFRFIWLNGSITLIRAETERYDIVRFSKVTTKSLASGIGSLGSNELGESKIGGEL